MILLTEKEIVTEASKDKEYCQLAVDVGMWAAREQLKKDHDWLLQFKDDIETIGDFWTFTIPNHEIQALKKEAGG